MASSALIYTPQDDISDYGSDLSVELIERLVTTLENSTQTQVQVQDIEDIEDIAGRNTSSSKFHKPRQSANGWETHYPVLAALKVAYESDVDFTTPITTNSNRASFTIHSNREGRNTADLDPDFLAAFLLANEKEASITEAPLERFRSNKNKQALSVTDLISTSWCELQYFYQLRTGKRKKQTPAMQKGTKVHKALEEEIMKPVVVRTVTREDGWGLRIWNVVQGLKTLREGGVTRELEVWGVIEGVVVNGIIDELSFSCPDADMEEDEIRRRARARELRGDADGRRTIAQYFRSGENSSIKATFGLGGTKISSLARNGTKDEKLGNEKKIYITDVKTRGNARLPNDASFRPTKMQLMLYHRLLHKLSTNEVDFPLVAERYNLDVTLPFSDSFIAEMAGIQDAPLLLEGGRVEEEDTLPILLSHNNLSLLWTYMITEFQKTFPQGRNSLGDILQAEYRTPSVTAEGGKVLGTKTFVMSDAVLDAYLKYEMMWWRGERGPVGVIVREAWKCRHCDFATGCEWRRDREEEFRDTVEKRRKGQCADVEDDADADADVEMEEVEIQKQKKRGRSREVELNTHSGSTSTTSTSTSKNRKARAKKTKESSTNTAKRETNTPSRAKRENSEVVQGNEDFEWEKVRQDLMVAEAEAEAEADEKVVRRGRRK